MAAGPGWVAGMGTVATRHCTTCCRPCRLVCLVLVTTLCYSSDRAVALTGVDPTAKERMACSTPPRTSLPPGLLGSPVPNVAAPAAEQPVAQRRLGRGSKERRGETHKRGPKSRSCWRSLRTPQPVTLQRQLTRARAPSPPEPPAARRGADDLASVLAVVDRRAGQQIRRC